MEKKTDYFLNGIVTVNQTEILDVKCKIYLPERVLDKPYMQFQLTSDQFDILSRAFKGEFKAERKNFQGKVDAHIIAPTVFFKNVSQRNWGHDLIEHSFEGEPQDLQIIHNYDFSISDAIITIIFLLSPNESLGPLIIEQTSMDGSIKVEKSHHLEIEFYGNKKLILDKDYKTRETEGKERLQWSYLVAKIHISDPTFSIEQINELLLSKVDDFLLIAGLATSIRTACIGWEASKGKTSISYYRGNLTFPTGMKQEILDQGLVSKRDLQEFINHCYDAFLNYENKAVLRGAIYSLVPGNERTLETSFLSLFAGLEMLLLDYRRGKNLEFNIEPDLWKDIKQKIQKEFKKVCKESDGLEITSNQRKNIYGKLDELNRISLRTVWEDFCQTYKLEVKDLWPLFTQNGIVGLSNIRNWLIHGEPIPEDCFGALMIACENLKWILERVIVTLLGWEVSRTEVDPQFLKRYADALLNDMSNEQKQITKMFEKGK